MSDVIKNFTSKFTFEVDHNPLEKMEKQLDAIKGRLEFLAAAEILKGIFELGEKFAHFAEELHGAANAAGVTVEAFQKLAFAAGQNGVSQDEMGSAMTRLSRTLYNAKTGSEEAQKAFAAVGITGEQVLSFKNSGDAMLAVSDRMQHMQNGIEKTALTTQLFGRNSANMVTFLSKGSGAIKGMGTEAEKLGIILSGRQVEALVHLEHSLQKVYMVFKAIGATIATYLAPILESAIKNFTDFYQANHKVLNLNIKKWAEDFAFALGFIHGLVQGLIEVFLQFASTHQTLVRRIVEFFMVLGALAGAIWAAQKVFGVLQGVVGLATKAFEAFQFVLELIEANPIIAALGLLVIAIHDVWNAAHGKPTWIGAFLEFLGIGKQIDEVFQGIFQLISDIIHLNFSKLIGDVGDVVKSAYSIPGALIGKIGGAIGVDTSGVGNFISDKLSHLTEGKDTAFQNAIGANATPSFSGGGGGGGQTNVTSVNAPVTNNIYGVQDPKKMADDFNKHIEKHTDTANRRAAQSFAPVEHY